MSMRIIKKLLVFILILDMSVFAAVVSDNDGSAFITKAEFDSLKNTFQSQLDSYNTQIDAKIDGAISSYLAGIKVDKTTDVRTAFDIVGVSPVDSSGNIISDVKTVHFMAKDMNVANSANEPYASSKISWFGVIGYHAKESFYMDTNNSLQAKGTWENGDKDNCVLVSDDGYVEEFLENVQVLENRNMVCQARHGSLLWAGGVWKSLEMVTTEPTEQQVKAWTTTTTEPCITHTLEVRGMIFDPPGTAGSFNWEQGKDTYYRRDNQRISYVGYGVPNIYWLDTNYSVKYTNQGTLSVNYQWPFGTVSGNEFAVKTKVKDSSGNETAKGHYYWGSSIEFEETRPFSISTGIGLYAMSQFSDIRSITTDQMDFTGTTARLNCELKSPSNYKYSKIKNIWNKDAKLSGGLLLLDTSSIKDGTLEIEFKANQPNTWLYFKNSTFTSKPAEGDTSNIECEIYNETTDKYEKTYNPKLITQDTVYKLKVPVKKGDDLYLGVSVNNQDTGYDVEVSTVGTAKIISSD